MVPACRAVAARGVEMTTFDTEGELIKTARWAQGGSLLLRIRADDPCAPPTPLGQCSDS